MRCSVAREALSARIDGEREPVPAARVDEHLEECADCARWYLLASRLTTPGAGALPGPNRDLADRIVRSATSSAPPRERRPWLTSTCRYGLTVAGVVQILLAVAQAAGLRFGMFSMGHEMGDGGRHLLNESTAIMLGLGLACAVAAWWTRALAGVVVVLIGYSAILAIYVVHDLVADEVTVARAASHLPLLAALGFAVVLWRRDGPDDGFGGAVGRRVEERSDSREIGKFDAA